MPQSFNLIWIMLSLVGATTAFAPVAPLATTVSRATAPQMGFGKAQLEGKCSHRLDLLRSKPLFDSLYCISTEIAALAKEQNPVLGYWDPIGLADLDLWGQGEEASIGPFPCFRNTAPVQS